MFEVPQDKEEASRAALWIGVAVVAVLVVVGVLAYVYRGGPQSAATATAPAAAVPAGKADPLHDLRVISSKMDKDYTGTVAMWSVDVKNDSRAYTYSKITYQTTYAAADSSVLATNKGTMKLTVGPGEDQTANFRDALYPTGTAIYSIKITGATATTQ
jgi:hypothetical protein